MVQEKRLSRLHLLGMVGDGDDILQDIVSRHDILLGKLIGEVGLGNILYGIEDPTQKVQVLAATGTSDLTLSTSAQSIIGDGDDSKVRIILPLPGDWLIEATFDFNVTATDPDSLIGELYVNDSGSPESRVAVFWPATDLDRATVPQRWKITTTAINTPIELKAKKNAAGGTALAETNTRLTAIGGGGAADIRLSNHGLLEGLSDIADHAYASLINGNRAFTGVVGGIFPTEHAHLVTKEYVDSAIHFIEDYFFNDTQSSYYNGGEYYKMLDTPTGEAESTFQSGSLGEGENQGLVNFATDAGLPGVTVLEAGVYTGHIHARVTLSNKRPTKIHFKVYFRTNGSETLVATSEETGFLTNSSTEYNLHATVVADTTIATTDRLIIKWLANVDSTPASDVIVELFAEGTNASRFEVPVTTDVLNHVFLRQDGTKPLLANWPVGSKKLTGLAAGSSAGDSVRYEQLVAAASTAVAGKIELATVAEIDAATPARAVMTDALGDSNYGERVVGVLVSDPGGDAITTGNGKVIFRVPSSMNGFDLIDASCHLSTPGTSTGVTIQFRRSRRSTATSRSEVDMLTVKLTTDATEYDSIDAATGITINASNDDVVTGDAIIIDLDGVPTGGKGLFVELIFRLP